MWVVSRTLSGFHVSVYVKKSRWQNLIYEQLGKRISFLPNELLRYHFVCLKRGKETSMQINNMRCD